MICPWTEVTQTIFAHIRGFEPTSNTNCTSIAPLTKSYKSLDETGLKLNDVYGKASETPASPRYGNKHLETSSCFPDAYQEKQITYIKHRGSLVAVIDSFLRMKERVNSWSSSIRSCSRMTLEECQRHTSADLPTHGHVHIRPASRSPAHLPRPEYERTIFRHLAPYTTSTVATIISSRRLIEVDPIRRSPLML